jgi:hypothetical protein
MNIEPPLRAEGMTRIDRTSGVIPKSTVISTASHRLLRQPKQQDR